MVKRTQLMKITQIEATTDLVSLNGSIGNLRDDVCVREPNNKPVFRSIVFIPVLDNEALSSEVICLSLTPSSVFNLESLEVSLILDDLYKTHGCFGQR